MRLEDIHAVIPMIRMLYDIDINTTEFEDLAVNAWEQIGSKHTRLYRYVANTKDKMLELPCNLDVIESVHIPINDAQMTSNQDIFHSIQTLWVENYIDLWKRLESPIVGRGKLVKYWEAGNQLQFSRDYRNVMIIYHGVIVGDDGLPLVNEKEQRAIAANIAYVYIYKEALKKRDKALIELSQLVKRDWLKYCNAARIPSNLSQNDMDQILDVKVRWDRKQFGKSIKPIL